MLWQLAQNWGEEVTYIDQPEMIRTKITKEQPYKNNLNLNLGSFSLDETPLKPGFGMPITYYRV